MEGQEFAKRIVENYGTSDVFFIAEEAGVKIIYESWFPVTIGEFDRRNKLICVNLNAKEPREKIIAHELGHFFAADLRLNKADEENFCHEFARRLLEPNPEEFIIKRQEKTPKENERCKL